jgi:type I restriction enzyme S subunit
MAAEKHRSTLGDYFTLQRGTTYKSRLLGKAGPVLLGLASIQRNGGFRSDSLQTYGGDSPDKLLVQSGELYVSLKDVTQSADLLGAIARLPIGYHAGRLTQDTVKLVPKGGDVPIDYLYWLLRTPQYRHYCRAHATGTTNLGLAREDFLAFPAPEPTQVQLVLVETLRTIDAKIELNRVMNATLESVARTLFKAWFVEFAPVRAKAEGRDPRLPKYLADQFPDSFEDSELGEIPTGWRVGHMGDLMEVSRDGISPYDFPDETFDHFSIPAFDEGRQPKIENGASIKSNKFVVPPSVVLLSKLNPRIPRVWLPDLDPFRRAVCSTEFLVVLPHADTTREFLFCLFGSEEFATAFASLVTGTSGSHQRVRPEGLAGMRIIVPKRSAIQEFTTLVRPLFERRSLAVSERRSLSSLRDTLLPKLISGKLRVMDVDRLVSGAA